MSSRLSNGPVVPLYCPLSVKFDSQLDALNFVFLSSAILKICGPEPARFSLEPLSVLNLEHFSRDIERWYRLPALRQSSLLRTSIETMRKEVEDRYEPLFGYFRAVIKLHCPQAFGITYIVLLVCQGSTVMNRRLGPIIRYPSKRRTSRPLSA
jgi:hypothetical protein